MEMALTGDPIEAERAHELGLVNRLAEPGEALTVALELAETIAANGPLALAATKRIMVESIDWPDSEFFERQGRSTTRCSTPKTPARARRRSRSGARRNGRAASRSPQRGGRSPPACRVSGHLNHPHIATSATAGPPSRPHALYVTARWRAPIDVIYMPAPILGAGEPE